MAGFKSLKKFLHGIPSVNFFQDFRLRGVNGHLVAKLVVMVKRHDKEAVLSFAPIHLNYQRRNPVIRATVSYFRKF